MHALHPKLRQKKSMNTEADTRKRSVLKWSVALTIYYLFASIFFQDVALHDESTFYLSQKERLSFSSFLTGAEYGPLYALWYKGIALLVQDNLALYFASWALLVVFSVELMRRATKPVGSVIPILITLGLPIFKVSPYVGLFASVVILGGFLATTLQKNTDRGIIAIALSGLLAGLARPEFLYAPAFLLLGSLACTPLLKKPRLHVILVCALITALSLSISRSSDTGRGAVAFEQHFNLRASERGEIGNQTPWTAKHARLFFFQNEDRDTRYKLSDYLKANPTAVASHIVSNVTDARTLMLLLASAGIAFFLYRSGRSLAALYVAVMSLPPIISCAVIYPRNHYVVTIILTLVAAGAIVLNEHLSGHPRIQKLRTPALVTLLLMVFVFSLNLKALKSFPSNREHLDFGALHPITSTILQVRRLEQRHTNHRPKVIFEPYGGINIYLQQPWQWVAEYDIKSGDEFLSMIRSRRVSIFVINDYVAIYLKLSRDEIDKELRRNGFDSLNCNHQDCTIYITTK